MEKLKMESRGGFGSNLEKIAKLFPCSVTEYNINGGGKIWY